MNHRKNKKPEIKASVIREREKFYQDLSQEYFLSGSRETSSQLKQDLIIGKPQRVIIRGKTSSD